jgi:hypothetical protein
MEKTIQLSAVNRSIELGKVYCSHSWKNIKDEHILYLCQHAECHKVKVLDLSKFSNT